MAGFYFHRVVPDTTGSVVACRGNRALTESSWATVWHCLDSRDRKWLSLLSWGQNFHLPAISDHFRPFPAASASGHFQPLPPIFAISAFRQAHGEQGC